MCINVYNINFFFINSDTFTTFVLFFIKRIYICRNELSERKLLNFSRILSVDYKNYY